MLQKSLEATDLDTHSSVNNWSNSKKELYQKYKFSLNNN